MMSFTDHPADEIKKSFAKIIIIKMLTLSNSCTDFCTTNFKKISMTFSISENYLKAVLKCPLTEVKMSYILLKLIF